MPSNRTANQGYPDCTKTPALTALLSAANIEPVYVNYCLKGSQADFVDNVGLDIRVGNSVTEDGFVPTASCMTCHGRSVFDKNGKPTSRAGFLSFDRKWADWPARTVAAGMVLELQQPAADL